ncbi:MAG: MFS transporter [Clostridia bacterium]
MRTPVRLVAYLFVLFFVLIAMGVFRSPAVALMPDVTPKPLRSQANAIINLAGGIGGALAFLVYTIVLAINPTAYTVVYVLVAGLMLVLLACFCKLVNEPKMVLEKEEICLQYGIAEEEGFDDLELEKSNMVADASIEAVVPTVKMSAEENKKLEKAKLRSFLLILASIFMWFMGYNAVTSNLSVYSTKALGMSAGTAGLISGISMGISAIAFIPVGMLAVKIGRRKSIMIGFLLAVVSFLLIWLFLKPTGSAAILFTIFYLIAGFGLIIANVNTFPMVVELSKAGDVGKYTGFYYMATMSAQAITPFIAGLFMDNITMKSLFAYAAVCVIIAIVLMAFVKHGDSRPLPSKKGKGDKITETEK